MSIDNNVSRRQEVEDALRTSEERYRRLVEMSHEGILIVCRSIILYANTAFIKILGGTAREQFQGKNLTQFVHLDFHEVEQKRNEKVEQHGKASEFVYEKFTRLDGTIADVEVAATPIDIGNVPASQVFVRDITERKQTEEKIRASLLEKEILLAEIHHRVKNNMAVISGLLTLQSDYVLDETARQMFRESQNRIKSMALIHEKLYESKTFADIDMQQYIHDLAQYVEKSYPLPNRTITVSYNVKDIKLSINSAVPCGLILNELISNAYKHAFTHQKEGEIIVSFEQHDQQYQLSVRDNGKGLPENFDMLATNTLGLTLVNALVMQLNGDLKTTSDAGTQFLILFEEQKKTTQKD